MSVIFSDNFVKINGKKGTLFAFVSLPFSTWKLFYFAMSFVLFQQGKLLKSWSFHSTLSMAICQSYAEERHAFMNIQCMWGLESREILLST